MTHTTQNLAAVGSPIGSPIGSPNPVRNQLGPRLTRFVPSVHLAINYSESRGSKKSRERDTRRLHPLKVPLSCNALRQARQGDFERSAVPESLRGERVCSHDCYLRADFGMASFPKSKIGTSKTTSLKSDACSSLTWTRQLQWSLIRMRGGRPSDAEGSCLPEEGKPFGT